MLLSLQRLIPIIEDAGRLRRIPNLTLSAHGTAAVQFRSGVRLCFEYIEARDKLYLYTPLNPLPSNTVARAHMLEAMLEANFLKLHTGRGTLSILREESMAIYEIELDATALDAPKISQAIEELLYQRENCLLVIARWRMPDAAPANPATPQTIRQLPRTATSPIIR